MRGLCDTSCNRVHTLSKEDAKNFDSYSWLLWKCLQIRFSIWGRAKSAQELALPTSPLSPSVKKIVEKTMNQPPISPIKNSRPESLLSQFKGEPQIMECSTISQLTLSREPTGFLASNILSSTTTTMANNIKGTYVCCLPFICCSCLQPDSLSLIPYLYVYNRTMSRFRATSSKQIDQPTSIFRHRQTLTTTFTCKDEPTSLHLQVQWGSG